MIRGMTKQRGMKGLGTVYRTTNNGKTVWCAAMTLTVDGKQRKIRGYGDTPTKAMERRAENLSRLVSRGLEQPQTPTLSEFTTRYLNHYTEDEIREHSKRKKRETFNHWILPTMGKKRIGDITDADAVRVIEACPYPSVRVAIHKELTAILTYAVETKALERSPMALVKRPKYAPERRALVEKTADAHLELVGGLLDWLERPDCPYHDDYPRVLMMMLGLRNAELLGLEWSCFTNLRARKGQPATVEIRQVLERHDPKTSGLSGWYLRPGAKSEAGHRTIPLPERWRKALLGLQLDQEMHRNGHRHGEYVWERDCVWLDAKGHVLRPSKHRQRWYELLEAYINQLPHRMNNDKPVLRFNSEEERTAWRKSWNPHTSRNLCATAMAQSGVPIETAQKILGHSSNVMTAYYTVQTLGMKNKAVESLAGAFSA